MGSFWFYEGETLGYRCAYVWLPNSDTVYTVAVNSQTSGAEDAIGALLQNIYATLRARGTIRSNGT
jgi:D-alanyl-D-alanine carboxypeptidase